MAVMADRSSISVVTLRKLEQGHPGVSVGTLANVLYATGMVDRFSDLADVRNDTIGLGLEEELLPKRIRSSGLR